MREIRSYGSVRERGGNEPLYSDLKLDSETLPRTLNLERISPVVYIVYYHMIVSFVMEL